MNRRRYVSLAIAGALAATGAALAVTPTSTALPAAPSAVAPAGCGPVLGKPARALDVARLTPSVFRAAVQRNAADVPDLGTRAVSDTSLWLDPCGRVLYSEPRATPAENRLAATSMGPVATPAVEAIPLDQTFALSSKPGANRTIYLDFRGGTVTSSNWNYYYSSNAPISYEPFSIDADVSTNFSDAELTEIQKAWQVVAEDYAPFDVNVTTAYPGEAAIKRTDTNDQAYGTRAVITNGGLVYDRCRCGGLAYTNAWKYAGSAHAGSQPAWIFSKGATTNGKYLGEAASHEVGHQFGLLHDGQKSGGDYYRGSDPWAPIMGTSYYQPVSQWSRGSYPDANNKQDDVALIAAGAPYRVDEDKGGAITLANGQTRDGIVARATDVDSYTFTAAGTVTVTVDNGSPFPDLDVQLKVTNGFTTVATANPPTTWLSEVEAGGMNASVTFTTPPAGGTYKVIVQGGGQGAASQPGSYSNYGSVGTYRISLGVTPPVLPPPVTVAAQSASGSVGAALSQQLVAGGGTGAYTWTKAAGTLPSGVSLSKTGLLSGKPYKAGTYTFTAKATSGSQSATGTVSITVGPALSWLTASALPKGKVGTPYAVTLVATGGKPGYGWALASGKLPLGLSLSSGGTISGTPTKTGFSSFTVKVTDASGKVISRTFSLSVGA
ncbi:hypothetical protein EFK50_10895 [Nocardioides marmoriginsengisoli]|uniref:Uncharacterized protein n=1 Tax=Nocardioides marmoriginsengisoli TaxID=661483 RepID=A0A3N0CGZ6_9ACTN|nr:putative Ig domain-containing protein [Nocardioides marmoriginsengisoli]RNL62283.1 hypothetical protein EFK50_10895 [Nocardioides marmoriginsengisoli]